MHIDPALLPTPDEVAHFREHGWYLTRRLFDDTELDAAIDASEHFYATLNAPEIALPNDHCHLPAWWRGCGDDVLRKNDYSTLLVPKLDALLRKPVLGAIAALLAGDDVRLWHDQLLYKPPSTRDAPQVVGWHTDRGYWKTCSSDEMLTAWVPFTEMTDAGDLVHHGNDDLTRGADGRPNYADPVYCPRVGVLAEALRLRDGSTP